MSDYAIRQKLTTKMNLYCNEYLLVQKNISHISCRFKITPYN